MSVGTDLEPLLLAVKATMQTVSVSGAGIGKISLEVGDDPGWGEDAGYKPPYWELSVLGATERDAGAGPQAWEGIPIQIEGFLPWYLPRETSALWRRMIVGVKDALRANPCLKLAGVPTVRDCGRPQWVPDRQPLVWFTDTKKARRCHHAIITLDCLAFFVWTPS